MNKLSSKQKADKLAELLAFMEMREVVAKVIERFSTEHWKMPPRLPDVPIQKEQGHDVPKL